MKDVLNGIPCRNQRQDSVSDQLSDLILIANRLGLYAGADAIRQWAKNLPELKYGCYCDLETGQLPDNCVLDISTHNDCTYAKEGMRKEQCDYWRPA